MEIFLHALSHAWGDSVKMLPFSDVWEEYLAQQNLSESYYEPIMAYEKKILKERK